MRDDPDTPPSAQQHDLHRHRGGTRLQALSSYVRPYGWGHQRLRNNDIPTELRCSRRLDRLEFHDQTGRRRQKSEKPPMGTEPKGHSLTSLGGYFVPLAATQVGRTESRSLDIEAAPVRCSERSTVARLRVVPRCRFLSLDLPACGKKRVRSHNSHSSGTTTRNWGSPPARAPAPPELLPDSSAAARTTLRPAPLGVVRRISSPFLPAR